MTAALRYICRVCGCRWGRDVSVRGFLALDLPIGATCPGCLKGD